jgi:hypothetical protein
MGIKTLTFEYNPANLKCHYSISIFSLGNDVTLKYEITVKSTHQPIMLRENTPQKNMIQMGRMNYYQFTLPAGDNPWKINFYLTPI